MQVVKFPVKSPQDILKILAKNNPRNLDVKRLTKICESCDGDIRLAINIAANDCEVSKTAEKDYRETLAALCDPSQPPTQDYQLQNKELVVFYNLSETFSIKQDQKNMERLNKMLFDGSRQPFFFKCNQTYFHAYYATAFKGTGLKNFVRPFDKKRPEEEKVVLDKISEIFKIPSRRVYNAKVLLRNLLKRDDEFVHYLLRQTEWSEEELEYLEAIVGRDLKEVFKKKQKERADFENVQEITQFF